MVIEKAGYEHPWSKGIFRDCLQVGYCCWVVEQEGAGIIGYGVMSVAVGESHLLNLCIHPDKQGNGFGRFLLNHLLETAKQHRAEMMFLEVRSSNKQAYHFYDHAGFNEVGKRRNYYPAAHGKREDALILARSLD